MVEHHVVDCFDGAQLGLEFEQIGLQNFDLHIVHVVFDELVHAVAQGVCLLQS